MKILYYIPAFGNPNINMKYEILNHNISYIYNQIKKPFDICINVYTHLSTEKIQKKCIHKIFVYQKKGVLTELFLTNPYNSFVKEYDYIFFIFDDVKIVNIDIKKMIEIKEKYNFEILSPKIINSTHPYMNNRSQKVSVNNFLEIYFLLLTPKDFNTFLSIHTIENKWMWGVDMLFGHYNIKVGIVYNFIAEHVKRGKFKNIKEAHNLMIKYLKQNTPYNCFNDITKKYKLYVRFLEIF